MILYVDASAVVALIGYALLGLVDQPANSCSGVNRVLDEHIAQIVAAFDSKANVEHFAQTIPAAQIAANDYNLSVSSYVAAKDTREAVNITQLNAELKTTVAKIDQLRASIDAIVAEIEGS